MTTEMFSKFRYSRNDLYEIKVIHRDPQIAHRCGKAKFGISHQRQQKKFGMFNKENLRLIRTDSDWNGWSSGTIK